MSNRKLKLIVDNKNLDSALWFVFVHNGSILTVNPYTGFRKKILVEFSTKVLYEKYIVSILEHYPNSTIIKFF